jgi:arabinose-5-phosphate isomerase
MVTRTDRDSFKALAVEPSKIEIVIDSGINSEAPHLDDLLEDSPSDAVKVESIAKADTNGNLRQAKAVAEFFDMALGELGALRTRAEIDAIDRAADLILDSEARGGRVHVTGIGKSEHIARYIASLLSSTGTPAYFLHATECVHGSAGQVCPADITIAISNSGTTPELLCAVEVLRNSGIKIIAVSGDRDSPLALSADVVLYAGVENEGGVLNLVPRASILAKIFVLCSLSVALESHKGLTREQYARWHPGGALGRIARGE